MPERDQALTKEQHDELVSQTGRPVTQAPIGGTPKMNNDASRAIREAREAGLTIHNPTTVYCEGL